MTDLDEEKKGKEIVPCGPQKALIVAKDGQGGNSEVRSVTEVRHGIVHFLAEFSPLQQHTNLNIPPSNWLRTSSKLERHVRDMTWRNTRKTSQFSSFEMAHNSPELAGEVDVISNASNIKQLLKIPFEQSHISMMVHRVGKSLLLDEFDIHKHLLRQEQTEWEWLRQFYYESVLRDFLRDKMKCVPRPSKSRDDLQNRNMYSKFLYHSLCESQIQQPTEEVSEREAHIRVHQQLQSQEKMLIPDPLPQPVGSQFHRELLWTFEDIKMLIGTDLPVFCDDSYYVSLRLKDMRTPINVLTGLDYWLDNLMCNVPEVAMCFHIDGIVQKYEIMKTEDIPQFDGSKFDPLVITDIAKNILTFLKTNATKEGHTYWLYKGTHDDVVKLYDLTALCDSQDGNPFTQPLGMLLYRLARNMWTNQTPGKASLIRTLLENCLYLLDEKKHPQVCTSANYLLSDVFVPDKSLDDDWSLPGCSSGEEETSDEETQQDFDESEETVTSIDVNALSNTSKMNRSRELVHLRPFSENTEERCREAVKHIHKGLAVLECDLKTETRQSNSIVEEQAECKSDEAIPLHYEPLNNQSNKTGSQAENQTCSTTNASETLSCSAEIKQCQNYLQMTSLSAKTYKNQTWHSLSKGLLLRKGCYTFAAIVKRLLGDKDYWTSLTYLRLAFSCFGAMQKVLEHDAKDNQYLLAHLYSLAGDLHLVLAKQVDCVVHWDELAAKLTPEEKTVLEMCERELDDNSDFSWVYKCESLVDINLKRCIQCYCHALDLMPKDNLSYAAFCKRKGNALNELGVWCMHRSQTLIQSQEDIGTSPSQDINQLWVDSKDAFLQGIAVFEAVGDKANQVLLHCNLGRLMRLCAHTHAHMSLKRETQEISTKERLYFDSAVDYYMRALALSEQGYKDIRQSIYWELSTTYFNMASLLQDYAPLSSVKKDEVEKEVINLMNKSLKYCKMETSALNDPMNQYRAATISHRLASLFHSSLRAECPEQKRRHLRQLAENHYGRAIGQFIQIECHVENLRVTLEYLKLLELGLPGEGHARARQKVLLEMLHSLIGCQESLKGFTEQLGDKDYGSNLHEEGETISNILLSRVQFILLQLMKTYNAAQTKQRERQEEILTQLKALYGASIQKDSRHATDNTLQHRCQFLHSLLRQVSKFYEKFENQERQPTL